MLKKMFLGVLFAVFVSGLLIGGINFNVTKAVEYSGSGTPVGGIIWENTTWSLENSPYIITDSVQIPENVTLTIEPGVSVISSTSKDLFLVQGKIYAHGTLENMITFEGGGNSNFFYTVGSSEVHAYVDLDYCKIKNGRSLFPCNDYAHLNMTHCEIIDVLEPCCPQAPTYIAYNLFKNWCSFVVGTSEYETEKIYITNNLFIGRSSFSDEYYTVKCIGHGVVVKYNSFLDNDQVLQIYPYARSVEIIATENYWGTNDTDVIDSMIYDKKDDIRCVGFIEYLPILTEAHPDTPTLPLIVSITYSPSVPYANTAIAFDASASFGPYSSIANYTWDFGDDNTTTLDTSIVGHTYAVPGDYNVTLTVTDEFGFKNSTTTSLIVLLDKTPPIIGIPSRTPEGDIQPNHEVKVSVNVTDFMSEIKNVVLSYNLNDSDIWADLPMTLNSTTGLYETTIPEQQANTLVKYKITAYDNAGNRKVEDNSGEYYVYTVVPEFPSTVILLLALLFTTFAVIIEKKRLPRKLKD